MASQMTCTRFHGKFASFTLLKASCFLQLRLFDSLGLIGKKTGERAARFSDWCWFLATIVALVELSSERAITKRRISLGEFNILRFYVIDRLDVKYTIFSHPAESQLYNESMANPNVKATSASSSSKHAQAELEKLHRQDYWLRMQRLKLIMDLIFVCKSRIPTHLRLLGLSEPASLYSI